MGKRGQHNMVQAHRSTSWVIVLGLLHVAASVSSEDGVEPLSEHAPLPALAALPEMPRQQVAEPAQSVDHAQAHDTKLGASQHSAKKYASPAEEKAKEAEVPEEVTCYHDLVANAENQ